MNIPKVLITTKDGEPWGTRYVVTIHWNRKSNDIEYIYADWYNDPDFPPIIMFNDFNGRYVNSIGSLIATFIDDNIILNNRNDKRFD